MIEPGLQGRWMEVLSALFCAYNKVGQPWGLDLLKPCLKVREALIFLGLN